MSPPTSNANGHRTGVGIGLLGCGVVGTPVARALLDGVGPFKATRLAAVAVRDPDKRRGVGLPRRIVTTDPLEVALDPRIEVVVELIGGIEPARTAILVALELGKPVVTANKELLARHGNEIFGAAEATGTPLFLEASVGGAIPIVRALQTSLAGDHVTRITGILNGTTNYILSRMHETGWDLPEALGSAQARGYAEAVPAADIEGFDAAAKVAILARLAFGIDAHLDDVSIQGISEVTRDDVVAAEEGGHVLKLVGTAAKTSDGYDLSVRVELVRNEDPLARVTGASNAIFVEAERSGTLEFRGQGAGGLPTASAVLGDIAATLPRRSRPITGSLPRHRSLTSLHLETCPTCRARSVHEPATG